MITRWRSLWHEVRHWHFRPPELFLLSVLLIVGSVLVFAIPVGAGWDEETHVIRVWEIASLSFIPNEKPRNELPFPAIYWNLSYRRPDLLRPIEPTFWSEYSDADIGDQGFIYGDLPTRSVYSPPLLLPQSLGMRYLGMARGLPALAVYYAVRLLGLLSYTALVWLAVRLVPFGKWVMAVVAVAPTAVFQAATVGADPISNGLGYLFVGGSLALSDRRQVGWGEWGAQVFLFSLLFLGKVNLVPLALLPFLIMRPSRFRMRAGYVLLAVSAVVLGLLEVGGWTAIAYSRLESASAGADPVAQLFFLASHPVHFAETLISDLLAHGVSYATQGIAEYGYDYWAVPLVTYPLYLFAIAAAVLAEAGGHKPPQQTRLGLAIVFIAGYLTTVTALYLADTPLASSEVYGVQGRYLASFAALPLLAMLGWSPLRDPSKSIPWAAALSASSVLVFGLGLLFSYHVRCGTAFFKLGLCYQPEYKNWDPNARYSAPISGSLELTQEIVPECDGLRAVRVWVDSTGAIGSRATEFSVYRPGSDDPVVTSIVPNGRLPEGGWYALQFATDWQSEGRSYRLTIRAETPVADPGPRIAYTLRPEYDAGVLYENRDPVEIDLVFKYGCVAGLERLALRMADYGLR